MNLFLNLSTVVVLSLFRLLYKQTSYTSFDEGPRSLGGPVSVFLLSGKIFLRGSGCYD